MVIYNVTVKVDLAIDKAYIDWVKETYIPSILQTGCFKDASIYHLVEHDDQDGKTYAIQFHADGMDNYKKYVREHEKDMQVNAVEKWGNSFLEFSTVMRSVN